VVAVACVDGRNAGVPFDSDGVVSAGILIFDFASGNLKASSNNHNQQCAVSMLVYTSLFQLPGIHAI
jgi:hypothetical protein